MRLPLIVAVLLVAGVHTACGQSGGDSADSPADNATVALQVLALPERAKVAPQPIPKFAEYKDVKAKKATFFEYMNERVRLANDEVWQERLFLLAALEKFESSGLSEEETEQIKILGQYYKQPPPDQLTTEYFNELLVKVDIVPASLVLAQAANESGWGTSRFAVEGRNFFGIWCYQPGCGLKPKHRNSGSKHEVRKFRSVLEGVRFYIHNINIGHAYDDLRDMRAQVREEEKRPTGLLLAGGLSRYSERGEEYVKEIRSMIKSNKLSRYVVERTAL